MMFKNYFGLEIKLKKQEYLKCIVVLWQKNKKVKVTAEAVTWFR